MRYDDGHVKQKTNYKKKTVSRSNENRYNSHDLVNTFEQEPLLVCTINMETDSLTSNMHIWLVAD